MSTLVTIARWASVPLALVWLALVAECVRYHLRTHRPRPRRQRRVEQPNHVHVIGGVVKRWK